MAERAKEHFALDHESPFMLQTCEVNSPFNLRGEPIVHMPVDALLCFLRSDIDTLVLDDFVIDRSACRNRG